MILFAYGFRVFFLAAGLCAALTMAAWLAMLEGALAPPGDWPAAAWHAHEMLFGYAAAVIAGFLLTASPGWTDTPAVRGPRLIGLAALWLAGRLAMSVPNWLGAPAAAVIDIAFVPALLAVVTPPIVAADKARNMLFPVLLLLFAAANLAWHLDGLGVLDEAARPALIAAVDLVVLLIAIVGGRIVPAFTRNALMRAGRDELPAAVVPLEIAALGLVAAVVLADLLAPGSAVAGAVALAAAAANALRAARWRPLATRDQPILWVLHLAYALLVAGLALKGLAPLLDGLPADAGLHLLTVGAVGLMTLAVMSRAALGHTGRELVVGRPTVAAYQLVVLAAVLRAGVPLVLPAQAEAGWVLSALAWCLAFALYSAVYWPVLTRPRVDGKPG